MRRPTALRSSLLLLLVLFAPAGAARATDDPAPAIGAIDRLLAETYPAGEPGAAVLVERDGKVLLRQGYGMASLELGVPIRPEMVFRLGSITKQFTAFAILKLVEQGKLALGDDITRYLPDYPTHGQAITIEHLLTHTSGIKSYTDLPVWRKVMRSDLSVAEMIDLWKDEPADFAPGEKWLYDNSGYFLLGAILEKVTGRPYGDWLAENVFTPLGLAHTRYGDDAPIVPGRVAGYQGSSGHYENAPYISMTQPYAAGALVSTVDDLARWSAALLSGAALRPDLLARMTTPYRLKNGRATGYGYGLAVGTYEGHRLIGHGGGINGFATQLLNLPDDRLVVVVLSNNPNHRPDPGMLAMRIAARLIGKPLEDRKPVALAPAVLDRCVGVYRIDDKTTRVVTREGEHLYTQRLPGGDRSEALPVSATDFYYADSMDRLRFTTDAAGRVTGMVVDHLYQGPEEAVRTAEPLPAKKPVVAVAPALLDGLVGEYRLAPTFALVVTREGEHLYAQATGQPRFELFASSPDEFFLQVVDASLTFHRGPDGKATDLVLHQAGRDVPGKRVP
jgi:CubicO group peptidase (beta-lactamase class C family)